MLLQDWSSEYLIFIWSWKSDTCIDIFIAEQYLGGAECGMSEVMEILLTFKSDLKRSQVAIKRPFPALDMGK